MTWLAIGLIALPSLLLVWRFVKLSERVDEMERRRITDEYRVEQIERELRFYVHDVYDKVFGSNNRPSVNWWLIQAPVVIREGKQVHLMDIVGYGSATEAREYSNVLGKKHGGQFKPAQLTLKQYQELQNEQVRMCYANGGLPPGARPFVHHADWLSDALDTECSDAGDQEEDAQRFDNLAGSVWVDGRLVKAKNLWEQLYELKRKVNQLHIS